MSIKGIDTQIMITRTADAARDTSAMQRHPQISQENTADRFKAESVLNQSRVQSTEESEMENIRTDIDGGGSGAAGGGGSPQDEEEMTEEQMRDLMVAPAEHEQIIDIMI